VLLPAEVHDPLAVLAASRSLFVSHSASGIVAIACSTFCWLSASQIQRNRPTSLRETEKALIFL
jgi:hypothetical protein